MVSQYGGSYTGERKLSLKLVRKYGSKVKLLLAEQEQGKEELDSTTPRFDESWYEIPKGRTGVIDFCSEQFDPVSLLDSPEGKGENIYQIVV